MQGPSIIIPAALANLVSFNGTEKYCDRKFTWIQKVIHTDLKFLISNKLGDKYENATVLDSFLNGKIYHFDLNKSRNYMIIYTLIVSLITRYD